MKEKTIDLYYFSGTGNTLLVAKKMKEVFEKNNVQVSLKKIKDTDPTKINTNNTIGLAFPVAAQGTYQFIWEWIKRMPNVESTGKETEYTNETDVFMIDTMGLYSGGIVGPVRKILTKKGYKPIGAKEIIMPNNFSLKR